jgi:hypothetical protein
MIEKVRGDLDAVLMDELESFPKLTVFLVEHGDSPLPQRPFDDFDGFEGLRLVATKSR